MKDDVKSVSWSPHPPNKFGNTTTSVEIENVGERAVEEGGVKEGVKEGDGEGDSVGKTREDEVNCTLVCDDDDASRDADEDNSKN